MKSPFRHIFFELEERVYRAPADNPLDMEIWNQYDHEYEPYRGDAAAIIRDASQSETEPALVH